MISDNQLRKNEKLKTRLKMKRQENDKKQKGEICKLHNCQMVNGRVNLKFGLPALPNEYLDARTELFPNSKLTLYAGCSPPIIDHETGKPDIKTVAEVTYCRKCRETEEDWLKTNPII